MDSREYKVNDYPDLRKKSGGVINTNFDEYMKCKKRRQKSLEISDLQKRVNGLEDKLDLILALLQK